MNEVCPAKHDFLRLAYPTEYGDLPLPEVRRCRCSSDDAPCHIHELISECIGQVAFIPGPKGRRDIESARNGKQDAREGEEDGEGDSRKIKALKGSVYTEVTSSSKGS